jgi:hypothetical protein
MQAVCNIALKEWQSVADALEAGRQIVLLRKGGIVEAGGEFSVEHPAFWLFPTYLHQNPAMLAPEWRDRLRHADAEPGELDLRLYAEITDVLRPADWECLLRLRPETVWTEPLLRMRWDYKPDRPLYLLLVRAYRAASPHRISVTPGYAGCKSWVELDAGLPTDGAEPVLSDAAYAEARARVSSAVG